MCLPKAETCPGNLWDVVPSPDRVAGAGEQRKQPQLGVPPTRVSEAGETDETRQGDQMGIRGEEGGCLRWAL